MAESEMREKERVKYANLARTVFQRRPAEYCHLQERARHLRLPGLDARIESYKVR
jgi:hypothetical protein